MNRELCAQPVPSATSRASAPVPRHTRAGEPIVSIPCQSIRENSMETPARAGRPIPRDLRKRNAVERSDN